jgi:hypothetical protein
MQQPQDDSKLPSLLPDDLEFLSTPESLKGAMKERAENNLKLPNQFQIDEKLIAISKNSPKSSEPIMPHFISSMPLALIVLSLALGTFLIALDTTIIGIAVPTITSKFHSLDDIAGYGSAYLITLTALQPSYTLYSVKTTYLACIAVFEGTLLITSRLLPTFTS